MKLAWYNKMNSCFEKRHTSGEYAFCTTIAYLIVDV